MQALRIDVILFLAFSALVSVQAAVLGRNPPFCEEVVSALAARRITQVFQSLNVGRRSDGVLCIDSFTFRVQQLFFCPEGFEARVVDTTTQADLNVNGRNSIANVVDLDQLSEQLNTTLALRCKRIPTPAPPMLGSCPRGPTSMRSYIRSHHTRLCRFSCSFGVAAQGASIGRRSRNIYWCCEEYGDPVIVSRASRLYRCGPLN